MNQPEGQIAIVTGGAAHVQSLVDYAEPSELACSASTRGTFS